ncbi:MAG: hypothetical protein PHI97_10860 [Desulfobulbus sp.]|nr:hypothetical protein [Desulfobulbus sp.]
MNTKLALLIVLLCLLMLTGCGGRPGFGTSFVGQIPTEGTASIVQDATKILVELYPPGRTSLKLLAPGQIDAFSQSFENTLRKQGFTLSPSGDVVLSYVLDALQGEGPPSWYLQLKITDPSRSATLARTYGADGKPVAGFSCLKTGGGDNE